MMDKEIYRLLNEIETDPDDYDIEEISAPEAKRIERHVKKQMKQSGSSRKIAAAAVLVVCLGVGIVFNGEVYAFVERVSNKIATIWDIQGAEEYTDVIAQSQEDQGYTITLNEVILDHDELIVSQTIMSEHDMGRYISAFGNLKINGRSADLGGTGSTGMVDENTQEDIYYYNISEAKLKSGGTNKIEYRISQISVYREGQDQAEEINGSWVFRFSVTGDQLNNDTLTAEMEDTIVLPEGSDIRLTRYSANPVNQKIYFELLDKDKNVEYDLELRGYDDLGNEVIFYLSRISGNEGVFKIETLDNGTVKPAAKRLVLSPYIARQPEESGRSNTDFEKIDQEIVIDINP